MSFRLFRIFFIVAVLAGCVDRRKSAPDPLRGDQWYLTGDKNDPDIVHLNLHEPYYRGRGVTIALVDDGVDVTHPDLLDRFLQYPNVSYLPDNIETTFAGRHGTACAGIIAASEQNGIGIRGIASQADLIAIAALKAPSIANLGDALSYRVNDVAISSNSWGDFNSWGEPFALRKAIAEALQKGVQYGRDGLGTIYVFAAGNGASTDENGQYIDNVNYSGYVNNRYTVPVCAVTEYGIQTSFSEPGATLIVCAPTGEGKGVTTTDVSGTGGYNPQRFPDDYRDQSYTQHFGGTSAAAPMVTGVIALMLEANPLLTWRDVRKILALSGRVVDADDKDWAVNGVGHPINHKYGFGLLDAGVAIRLAESWQNMGIERVVSANKVVNEAIRDGQTLVTEIEIKDEMSIEFVEIVFNAPDHSRIGDLNLRLISPGGTVSILAEPHVEMFGDFRYANWHFGSMRHLDENSRGIWTLVVLDTGLGHEGVLESWGLVIYGN